MANHNLQNALQDAGLTAERFAEVIRVNPKSVQRWLTGATVPYPKHRAAISRALDLSEHELWPDQRSSQDPDQNEPVVGCDVVGSWAYADDPTAPDLVAFVTDAAGPIDLLDCYCGIEVTAQLVDALAAQADAGRQVRGLTDRSSSLLLELGDRERIEIRESYLETGFWFIQAGERMLLAINFDDDVAVAPPPLIELDGAVQGGLLDRLQTKFQELWEQAEDILTSPQQPNVQPLAAAQQDGNPASDRAQPARGHQPPDRVQTPPPAPRTGELAEAERRRWPRRPD